LQNFLIAPHIAIFRFFSRWRPSAILDLWNVYLDNPRRVLGSPYHSANFGRNRLSSFGNMQVFLLYHFGLKMPIHAPKMRVLGKFDPLNGEPYQQNPKKAHPWARPRRLSHRVSKSVNGSDLWCSLNKKPSCR